MAFMRLCRGFNVLDSDYVEYPIYEMTIPTGANVVNWGRGDFPLGTAGSAIGFDYSPNNEDLSSFFPDSMPRRNSDEGCIVQNNFYYVQGPSSKIPNEQAFSDVPIGTKPDDWDTHFFDYYKIITMNNYTVFDSVANQGLAYRNAPPVWDATAAYYHDDLPVKSRFTQLFTTAAGVTFKVGVSTNTYYSYLRWECNINGNNPYGGQDAVSAPHYMGQAAADLGSTSTISYPNKLPPSPNELNLPVNVLQIFVHTTYNDKDYYGYGVVRMSAISENAHPTQANFCLFTEDFWGDSIQNGQPSPGGNWGNSSGKSGGGGTFTAVSDNSGDGTGAHAAQITQNWNTATAVAGNFYNLYRFNGPNDQALLEMAGNLWGAGFIESFLNSLVNPLSAIVSFHLIPEKFAPPRSGTTKRVYAGIKNLSTTTARTFTELMATLHFGPYNFDQFYDGFGDFEPYTELYIHLPYVGVYPIDLSACMGGQLSVDYYCDRLTGDCAAIVWVKDKYGNYRTRYEYKGNCARPLPIAQFSSAAAMGFMQGTMGVITSAVGMATGNPALASTGVTQVGAAIPQLTNNKFTVSNVSQGGATTPSDTTIYLIVVRKLWNNPNKYQNLIGLPSDISGTINSSDFDENPFFGFLSVRSVDVDALDATDEEKAEIVSLMTEGIYV